MSAHEAAVRALQHSRCLMKYDSPGLAGWWSCTNGVMKHPECAVAAIATSPEVRAAQISEYPAFHRIAPRYLDAILAALAPPTETGDGDE